MLQWLEQKSIKIRGKQVSNALGMIIVEIQPGNGNSPKYTCLSAL